MQPCNCYEEVFGIDYEIVYEDLNTKTQNPTLMFQECSYGFKFGLVSIIATYPIYYYCSSYHYHSLFPYSLTS